MEAASGTLGLIEISLSLGGLWSRYQILLMGKKCLLFKQIYLCFLVESLIFRRNIFFSFCPHRLGGSLSITWFTFPGLCSGSPTWPSTSSATSMIPSVQTRKITCENEAGLKHLEAFFVFVFFLLFGLVCQCAHPRHRCPGGA